MQEIDADTRTKIRQGQQYEVKVDEVKTIDDIKECFDMFWKTNERQGYSKPIYPLELFINIYQIMQNKNYIKWFKAIYQNKSIANVLSFTFKDSVMAWIAGSYKEFLNVRPNNVLYWTLIEFSNKEGYKYVNFSTVEEEQKSLLHFKEGFAKEKKYYNIYWKRKFGK